MFSFTLPFPPSNNTYYRKVNDRTVLSKKGREYKTKAADLLNELGLAGIAIDKPVIVRLELFRGDNRSYDSDNFFKAVYDALTFAKFWLDDALVVESQARKMKSDGQGRVEVLVQYDVAEGFY